MNSNSESIYDLITKLCENYIVTYQNRTTYPRKIDVKRVRSKCYEVLLSKKLSKKSILEDLENNTDPFCHLLAWQFQLRTRFNLPQYAEDLRKCSERLQELNAFDNVTVTNIVLLLLQLRRVPKDENKIMETSLNRDYSEEFTVNKPSVFPYFDNGRFQLPEEPSFKTQFGDEYFRLHNKKVTRKIVAFEEGFDLYKARASSAQRSDRKPMCFEARLRDESFESSSKSGNIWEVAACGVPNNHRTWESYGCSSSTKELPFLCESGAQPTTWLQNLSTSFENLITENYVGRGIMRKFVTHKQFIKDVKYLLVGMESKTFICNSKGELCLAPGTCVQGISCASIASYCSELLVCGSCYKGLSNLCTPNPFTQRYVHNGYIFLELCESIKRYLSYYRVAALAIPDTSRLLAFHEQTRQLRKHITVLASVCKVGPFTESGQIPHGVALLNYLYQKVMNIANKDVIMVLYSILYPCCQVYFNRFLQQWILEGFVKDPYGEFFINVNPKYETTRGRTYWTRSYSLREDIVPDFITDLRQDILLCGKTMNLLKLCLPTSPLCLYMMDKRPDIISCCVMAEQLSTLELNNQYYYLEATALSGPRISLSQIVTRLHEEDSLFLSLVAKKRAATLSRIESERKKDIEQQFEKKQKEMKILQEQYAEAQKRKQQKLAEELEEELQAVEKEMRMQTLHNRIIQEERNNLIKYYNQLFESSDNRRKIFERRIENLRKVQLDPAEISKKVHCTSQNTVVTPEASTVKDENKPKNTVIEKKSTDSFVSINDESEEYVLADTDDSLSSLSIAKTEDLESLDAINANTSENANEQETEPVDENRKNYLSAVQNFKDARKNKARVLGTEQRNGAKAQVQPKQAKNPVLTDAQKNKLKVMSSEYGTRLSNAQKDMLKDKNKKKENLNEKKANVRGNVSRPISPKVITKPPLTDAQKNKLKVTSVEYGNNAYTEDKQQNDGKNTNLMYLENLEIAQKNKAKVLSVEMGIETQPATKQQSQEGDKYSGLTDAQKNKLKVLSSEFGQDIETNRNRMIADAEESRNSQNSSDNRRKTNDNKKNFDNENFINKNVNVDNTIIIDNNSDQNSNPTDNRTTKKQDNLSLDFTKINNKENIDGNKLLKTDTKGSQSIKSPKFELDRISPMSVDSTPLSNVTTPSSKLLLMFDKSDFEELQSCSATTTATASTGPANCETGFNFEVDRCESLLNLESRRAAYNIGSAVGNANLARNITAKDASSVSPNCLKLCLQQSIAIPLITQMKLVNNELLKYFINNLQYLKHLNNLRSYFFLLDGEFGRNITEGLFEKLYDVNFPTELINHNTLQILVHKALDYSTKLQENSTSLSFKINNLPKVFNLGDPDVFDCISLTYKANWPLNILLPSDTISKYDDVFKFLLKLHRISWVLQNLFQDLKSLVKETECAKTKLLMSPHYRRLHQCRHVMTHFIQTLQSYVVGEVVQSSWEMFEKNLETVTNFDQLYFLHTTYIKNILFMCLLNQKSAPLRKTLQKIFIVILKFYDYLRSRSWIVENDVYAHPNFKKLEDIFSNFGELTQYLFKVCHKVVKSGYQPHLMQLLDMLDINNYYSNKNVNDALPSVSSK